MFRLRKKKPLQRLPLVSAPRQDPAYPMQVTRAFLFSLRYAHAWQQLVLEAYRAMPPEWQPRYRTYAELQISPTFNEILELIDGALQQGFMTDDEAATLAAGKPIPLDFGEAPDA